MAANVVRAVAGEISEYRFVMTRVKNAALFVKRYIENKEIICISKLDEKECLGRYESKEKGCI